MVYPIIIGFQQYKVMQDFFHPQYVGYLTTYLRICESAIDVAPFQPSRCGPSKRRTSAGILSWWTVSLSLAFPIRCSWDVAMGNHQPWITPHFIESYAARTPKVWKSRKWDNYPKQILVMLEVKKLTDVPNNPRRTLAVPFWKHQHGAAKKGILEDMFLENSSFRFHMIPC